MSDKHQPAGLGERLKDMGLSFPITSKQQLFPTWDGRDRLTIRDLVRYGANFEDTDPRALNHFYNPIDGLPLSVLGLTLANNTSPAWALEDAGEITGNIAGAQQFSYKDARGYFYKAFTEPAKDDRDRNWGLTFQSLGQVIHHVQDMAQPQHVRNDAHLDKGSGSVFGFQLNSLYNPSAYELYTNDNRETLPFSSGSAPDPLADLTAFSIPRAFWTDGQGRGLAQYTNANFLSAGTNFGSGTFASAPRNALI